MDIQKLIINELDYLLGPYRYYTYTQYNTLHIYNHDCYAHIHVTGEYLYVIFYINHNSLYHVLTNLSKFSILDPHCLSKTVCLLNNLMITYQSKSTYWYTIKTGIKSIHNWIILVSKRLIGKFTH